MIAVSGCLAGINCKYSGGNNLIEEIKELVDENKAITICPEQLGGLPTPRECCEIIKGKVITTSGKDVTYQFEKGAKLALEQVKEHKCDLVILKSYSPSCGNDGIYDGTFSHKIIEGKGVFAQLLAKENIEVITEKEYIEKIKGRNK